jgi:aquaporin Z
MASTTPAPLGDAPSLVAEPAGPLNHARIAGAEAVGTAILIMGGPGTAILAPGIGQFGIAMAFGFSLLIAAYAVGPISGCHINPAITLAMWLARKIRGITALFYVLGQVIGAFAGAFLIWCIASGQDTYERGRFAANGWAQLSPDGFGLGSVIVVEVVFTALLVLVVLMTLRHDFTPGFGPIAAGFTLALIHFITIPVDNTSVNPIRSLATAVFADTGQDYLQQVWAFIVFPLLGAILGVFVWLFVDEARLEGTLLFNEGLAQARDIFDRGLDEVVEDVEKLDDPDNNDPQLEDR